MQMKEVYIRLDGVVGNVIAEYTTYYNMLASPDSRRVSPTSLYGATRISPHKKEILQLIMAQPEPYRDMKMFEDSYKGIECLKSSNCHVILYSDDAHRKVKEEWMEIHDISTICDEFQWCSTNYLIDSDKEILIITTPFAAPEPKWKRADEVLYFLGYAKRCSFTNCYPAVLSWEDLILSQVSV